MLLQRVARRPFPDGCWPTGAQRLLLRACLLAEEAGRDAWWRWRASVELDELDAGAFRLLGLLYRNLGRLGVTDDSLLPRLSGIYRHFCAHHLMLLRGKAKVLRALHAREIPTLLIKGAALSLAVYRDPGVRPMGDFDLLVPRERALDAMAALRAQGFGPLMPNAERLIEADHGCVFERTLDETVDLHWRLMHTDGRPGTDDAFWTASRPLDLDGVPTRMLAPADQLLHTAEHGARYSPVPPLRWLADATAIIRTAGPALDWDRLLGQAVTRDLVLPVRETLAYLREELEVEVPPDVTRALAEARVSVLHRVDHALALRSRADGGFWARLPLQLCAYIRLKRGLGWRGAVADLPGYLQTLNAYDRSLWRRALAWLRTEGIAGLARPRAPAGEIAGFPGRALRGFHELERSRGQSFRWSRPEAAIRCAQPRDAYTAWIDVGGLRAWDGDLAASLALWFNHIRIDPDVVDGHGTALSFPVEPEMFTPDAFQVVRWRCTPLATATDPRPLGLPVFALRFEPVSGTPSLHGVHSPERARGHSVRWTRPRFLVRCRLLPGSYVVRVELGEARRWREDLAASLAVEFNGVRIPAAAISPAPSGFTFAVTAEMFAAGAVQAVRFACAPLAGPGDRPALGFPLLGIGFEPRVRA